MSQITGTMYADRLLSFAGWEVNEAVAEAQCART